MLLGRGGEASVYAIDDERIVRVLHQTSEGSTVIRRAQLVAELTRKPAPVALPGVLALGEVDGRWFTVERRLPGRMVGDELRRLEGRERDLLVEHHLDAAAALGDLRLDSRSWFGDLLAVEPVRSRDWRTYLAERATASLRRGGPAFAGVDADGLAAELPDTTAPAFVHLDAFVGNMLATGTTITAVLDIGPTALVGDRRLDPLAAAVYLASPQITPVATRRDVDVALSWLRNAGLADWFEPARRWLAAYWSSAVDDEPLRAWCQSVLTHD